MRILWPATAVLLFMALAYNSFEDRVGGCALVQDGTQLNSIDDSGAPRHIHARFCSREACLAMAAKMDQSPTRWFCL